MSFIIRISSKIDCSENKSTTSSFFINGGSFKWGGKKVGEIVWKDKGKLSLDISLPCTLDIITQDCICGYSKKLRYKIPKSATSMKFLENGVQIKSNKKIILDDTATTQSKILGMLFYPLSTLVVGTQRPYCFGVYNNLYCKFVLIPALVILAIIVVVLLLSDGGSAL